MARFKEATSAGPATSQSAAEPTDEARRTAISAPDPRDPVADSRRKEEGRVTIVRDRESRSGLRSYREGYADLRDRVLRRDTSDRGDPFLDADAQRPPENFPSTESLSPRSRTPERPSIDGSVARADLQPKHDGNVGQASMQRTTSAGVARTSPTTSQTSRLEQLRAELRNQQAAATAETVAVASAAETPRGTVLSDKEARAFPEQTAIGVARISKSTVATTDSPRPQQDEIRTASMARAAAPARPAPADSVDPGAAATTENASSDVVMRVQSLLTTAEWLASRGELDQAYRNAILAQHLAEYGKVSFGPADRRPSDVVHHIWQTMHETETGRALAEAVPKPRESTPASAAETSARLAVASKAPAGTFPAKNGFGWEKADGPSTLIPDASALPVIAPRGTATPPVLRAPGAISAEETPEAASPELEQVADAESGSPISLTRIETVPAEVLAARRKRAQSEVVTALAETSPAVAARRREANTEPTGLTVPAMATLPKANRPLPGNVGPALRGPKLAPPPEVEPPPPYLEVMGARQLPDRSGGATAEKSSKRPMLWGMGGLIAILLGAAYAFRRRWSAGAAGKSSNGSASGI
ncbi:MAG: hypothetical protein ACK5Q5_02800 [Planctomycetaceae bacterium]